MSWMKVWSGQELNCHWLSWELWGFCVLSPLLYDIRGNLGCRRNGTAATRESSCWQRSQTLCGVQSTDFSFRALKTHDLHNQAGQCLLLPHSLEENSQVCLSSHRKTGIQLLCFLSGIDCNEMNEGHFLTLSTHHTVINFESNNGKQNWEKIGIGWRILSFWPLI